MGGVRTHTFLIAKQESNLPSNFLKIFQLQRWQNQNSFQEQFLVVLESSDYFSEHIKTSNLQSKLRREQPPVTRQIVRLLSSIAPLGKHSIRFSIFFFLQVSFLLREQLLPATVKKIINFQKLYKIPRKRRIMEYLKHYLVFYIMVRNIGFLSEQ